MQKRIITIGRGKDNDIVLDEPNVSTSHARLIVEGERFVLEDLGSTNGTSVGRVENKISRSFVSLGDAIYFGSTRVLVEDLLNGVPMSGAQTQSASSGSTAFTDRLRTPWAITTITGSVVAVVLGIIVIGVLVWPTSESEADIANELPEGQAPQVAMNSANEQPPVSEEIDDQATPPKSAAELLEESLFLLVCSDPDEETPFRVGNAFAVSSNRVATTGSVIQAMQELQRTGYEDVFLYSPKTGSQWRIKSVDLHPRFSLAEAKVREAIQKYDRLIDGLEDNPPGPEELDQVKTRMVAARQEALEAIDEKVCFDIALITVDGPIESWLEGSTGKSSIRPKQRVRVSGFAFDLEDPYFDRDFVGTVRSLEGRVQQVWRRDDLPLGRVTIETTGNQHEYAFLGCPVLDEQNHVIGIYSRPSQSRQTEGESTVTNQLDSVQFQYANEMLRRTE